MESENLNMVSKLEPSFILDATISTKSSVSAVVFHIPTISLVDKSRMVCGKQVHIVVLNNISLRFTNRNFFHLAEIIFFPNREEEVFINHNDLKSFSPLAFNI